MTPKHPNLLFVFADQWRRQAAGFMHADPVITPRMDRFAAESTVFENTVCNSPLCTPSRASIITGRYPYSVGMMHNWLQLPTDAPSFGKTARQHGYDTAYIGKWHLEEWDGNPEHGNAWCPFTPAGPKRMGFDFWYANGCLHRHFELQYMKTNNEFFRGEGWQIDHETRVAIDYILNEDNVRVPDRPFCLFLSWGPPHTHHGGQRFDPGKKGFQYAAPEEYEQLYRGRELPVRPNARRELTREHAPGYFGAITSMDDNFGTLLDCLEDQGLADNTIVVLTSDHGDMLGSHGMLTKDVWYEESIGIPLAVRWPGRLAAGRREPALVSTVDFLPTLSSLMGCHVPGEVEGRDLSSLFLGGSPDPGDDIFLCFAAGAPPRDKTRWDVFPDEGNRDWRGVRTPRYTYVAASREQYGHPERFAKPLPEGVRQVLFDLESDPWQVNPIYPGQGQDETIADLHSRVAGWLQRVGDPFLETLWI